MGSVFGEMQTMFAPNSLLFKDLILFQMKNTVAIVRFPKKLPEKFAAPATQ